MSNDSYSELKRNTIIIGIANFGSKAISFILAPLYSYFLSTAEYGTMDLIINSVSLLVPYICFDIYEGTFRFSNESDYDDETVLSSSLGICFGSTILFGGIFILIGLLFEIPLIVYVCLFSALLSTFQNVLMQYARGKGEIKAFAFSGILNSITLLASNIILMVLLSFGLTGWLVSFVLAKVCVVVYLVVRQRVWSLFSLGRINSAFIRVVLKYCLPLMPSASMWWIMNASDRYMISWFIGMSATGIYAVAAKLPSLLSIFENVFYQSWQTTAINTVNGEKRNSLYSDIFEKFFKLLVIGAVCIFVALKPLIYNFFAEDYWNAWICASVLVIGVLIHALAGNLGTIYIVFKDTTGALKTSAIGACTNILLNLFFIPIIGMNAAAWTTLISYFVVLIIRWFDVRKFVELQISLGSVAFYCTILCIQLSLYYFDGIISYVARAGIAFLLLLLNRDMLLNLIKHK